MNWKALAIGVAVSTALLCACSPDAPSPPAAPPPPAAELVAVPAPVPAANTVAIITPAGEILLELLPDKAPQTVTEFKRLAAEGFYNGTTFHRVVKGSLVQGGDPLGEDPDASDDGEGTSGRLVPGEIDDVPMQAGAVAMAHPGDPNQASCQFFICVKNHPEWQGQFTVFARVAGGMDVVEKISAASVGTGALSEHPIFKQTIERIVFKEP